MSDPLISLLLEGTWETLYMVGLSGFFSILGGLPLGVILMLTRPKGILRNLFMHKGLGCIVDVLRAIPFIILLIAIVPFTRLLVGTSIGTHAAIVPLSIAAIPFVARIVENALVAVDGGLLEAGEAMGATPWQLVYKILLPEARPAILRGFTLTLISLVGYSAMAGAVGGGGLGSIAINYGYQRFELTILLITVMLLILLVYAIQWTGDWLAKRWEYG
jgi:D-methionine transport system permease protein